jgi:hypothetical protein
MNETILVRADEHLGARVIPQESIFAANLALAALALARFLFHFAGITRYGFFRDELYYMACGQHPAWGYVDQPPLVAFVARFSRHAFGDSIVSVRLLPAIAGAALVFLAGLVARELGGRRLAQLLAAIAMLFAPLSLAFNSFLSMNAFEPVFWLLCAWTVVRIVKGASPKLWLAFGAIAGLGLENKHTMLVFGVALVAGLVVSGEARVFRSKWFWIGGLIALALFLPNLIWETRNGWPQIVVVRNAQHFKNSHITPLRFLGEQTLFLHPIALPIWLGGLAWFFATKEGKHFRFVGWTFLFVLGIFIGFNGKSYYPFPAYPMLLAAGGVAFERFVARPHRRWLRVAYPALLVLAGLITVPFGVPLLPLNTFLSYSHIIPLARGVKTERDSAAPLPQIYGDMIGWDKTATAVARVYHALPDSERTDCAILAGNYGEAGAIDYYGPKFGLPRAISGHNSYFYWGPRNYSGACVILFGERAAELKELFGDAPLVATVTNPLAMPAEQTVPIYLCHRSRAPLALLWPRFKFIL